jgi:alpha-galactosidase
MDTDLVLTYSVYEDYPVITRSARLVQKGDQKIRLENVMSAAVEFPDMR